MDPNYQPYGRAPNGYTLAMALRKLNKDNAPVVVAAAARPVPKMLTDEHGIPDGYKTALAERNGR